MKFLKTILLGACACVGVEAQTVPLYRTANTTKLAELEVRGNSAAIAVVTGRSEQGDAGGGVWYFDGGSTLATNIHNVIKPVTGDANGRWLKVDVSGLAPQEFYQALPAIPGMENSYAVSVYRGTPASRTNHIALGADNNSGFVQSLAGKGLSLNAGGNPVMIGQNGTQFFGIYSAVANLDFPSVAANTTANLTITVTGAAVGDSVSVGTGATLTAGLSVTGYVSAPDTVTIRVANSTVAPIDPASATFRATVIHY